MDEQKPHIVAVHTGEVALTIVAGYDEQDALEKYVQAEYRYGKCSDGIYREREVFFENIQDILDIYGLFELEAGRYANGQRQTFDSLQDLMAEYGIVRSGDSGFLCTGKPYSNIMDLLADELPDGNRIEVREVPATTEKPREFMYAWPYIETNVTDDHLAIQLLWQARRYEARDMPAEAVRELECALGLEISDRNRMSISWDAARLCVQTLKYDLAINLYNGMLAIATPYDNAGHITYLLAHAYDNSGDFENALITFRKAIELEPEHEDRGLIVDRIAELQAQLQ